MYFFNKMLNFIEPKRFGTQTHYNMQTTTFVAVAEYCSLAEAELAKTRLQDAEIWVDIRNEYMSSLNAVGGAATLVVRAEDEARARRELGLK